MFIDTHTHYYDEWFGEDGAAAVQRALDAGMEMMLQADVDSRERDRMFELAEQFPVVLRQMLGLYPGSVREDWREEIDAWVSRLNESIVAIGEIGLDYHEGTEFKEQQKEALRVQLEIAAEHNLPVDIHLRDAWDDLFRILEDCRHLQEFPPCRNRGTDSPRTHSPRDRLPLPGAGPPSRRTQRKCVPAVYRRENCPEQKH